MAVTVRLPMKEVVVFTSPLMTTVVLEILVASGGKVGGGTMAVVVAMLIQMAATSQVVSVELIGMERELYGVVQMDIGSTRTQR